MSDSNRPTVDDANRLLGELFAEWVQALNLRVERIDADGAVLRLPQHEGIRRIGGIVCVQASMTLIDTCMVFVCFAALGRVADVTTVSQSTSFMRAAGNGDLLATGRVLKAGRQLVFGEVTVTLDGDDRRNAGRPIAHGTSTYAVLPPRPA
ncbi:MAG: PaaI family thioesterase [Pseudomonadota bacterium]